MSALKLRAVQRGHHVHVDVFVGPSSGQRALSGRLVFSVAEWEAFASIEGLHEMTVEVEDDVADVPSKRTLGVLVAPKEPA